MSVDKEQLLIVEDDPGLQSQLKWSFEEYKPTIKGDRKSALEFVKKHRPAVVITDLGLPPDPGGNSEGLALLQQIVEFEPDTKVIVVTGREEKENAVISIGQGAYDYYQKPIDADMLKFVIDRAYKLQQLEEENRKLARNQAQDTEGLIGTSPSMLEIFSTVDKVAPTSVTVLLLGETGTGKGELARSIHTKSERRDNHLVTINCSSIPEALLESELFGHEKGAFTGAVGKKIGKFEYANGGTLFLDEIGDMPVALQAKILHVLQERRIVRLGGNAEIEIDVRVICATHQDLEQRIQERLFREDLFYRISEIVIKVPPLRDRTEDIPFLAKSFLRKFADQHDRKATTLSQAALAAMQASTWPGNIRELENKIKRAVVMADKPLIGPEDLQMHSAETELSPESLREVRARAESSAIVEALGHHKSMSDAAKSLGITRPTLYNLINKYDLDSYLKSNQE